MNDLILYSTEDGRSRIKLRAARQTVWLSQREMAELFNVSVDNIGLHLKNIYQDGELVREATAEESSVVQTEDEIDTLNRLVVIFLEMAELFDATKQNISLHLKNLFEEGKLDTDSVVKESLTTAATSNGFPLLSHAGSVSHEQMKNHTFARYLEYDQQRKTEEAQEADFQDEAELKALEAKIKNTKTVSRDRNQP